MPAALTPEEWTEQAIRPTEFDPKTRHRLAALALHGQEYGFSHQDHIDLVLFISQNDREGMSPEEIAQIDRLCLLAEKLAALLPPRGFAPPEHRKRLRLIE